MKISELLKIRKSSGNPISFYQSRNKIGQFGTKNVKKCEKASRRDFAKVKSKLIKIKSKWCSMVLISYCCILVKTEIVSSSAQWTGRWKQSFLKILGFSYLKILDPPPGVYILQMTRILFCILFLENYVEFCDPELS